MRAVADAEEEEEKAFIDAGNYMTERTVARLKAINDLAIRPVAFPNSVV